MIAHGGPTPEVTVGRPTVGAGLDEKIVRGSIRRHASRLLVCYERQLVVDPALGGTVTARFTIGTDGRVTGANARGVDTEVAACVAGVLAAIEFPRQARGGLEVVAPVTFASAGG